MDLKICLLYFCKFATAESYSLMWYTEVSKFPVKLKCFLGAIPSPQKMAFKRINFDIYISPILNLYLAIRKE